MDQLNALDEEGIPYRKDTEIGIMIETPASFFQKFLLQPPSHQSETANRTSAYKERLLIICFNVWLHESIGRLGSSNAQKFCS